MKKILLAFFYVVILTSSVFGQDILNFKISRPYCLLNFLQASMGENGTSGALKEYIEHEIPKGDTVFSNILNEFASINLNMNFHRDGFPENRRPYRSTLDLICIAAVQSNTLEEFSERTVGILPNSDHSRFFQILKKTNTYYEKILWSKYGEKAVIHQKALEKYQAKANRAFIQLKRFYHSNWSDDMPFTVALVPVPSINGNTSTSATPHGNSLCVDVLTDEKDYEMRISIIMHEVCHILYDEQSRAVQHELNDFFAKNTSEFKSVAFNFFDEGMATACGNGWSYQFLTGKIDAKGWYSDEYIDGFGHVLYPLVKEYLENEKVIDSAFVQEAIRLFGEKFPKANIDIGVKMNRVSIYAQTETNQERVQLRNDMYHYFAVTNSSLLTPILEAESVERIKKNQDTQIFVIDRSVKPTLKALKKLLPNLKDIKYSIKDDFIINYLDRNNRLIILIKASLSKLDLAYKTLKEQRYVKKEQAYIKF